MTDGVDGGGLDLRPLGERGAEDPGGTGGASGGGTMAGAGEPSGGTLDGGRGQSPTPVGNPRATPAPDTLAGIADSEVAGEAAALGPADGALADMARGGEPQPGAAGLTPSGGETVGAGPGRGSVGAGLPGDTSELGGGDPMAGPGGR